MKTFTKEDFIKKFEQRELVFVSPTLYTAIRKAILDDVERIKGHKVTL